MREDLRDLAVVIADSLVELRESEREYRELVAGGLPPGHPWRRRATRRAADRSTALRKVLDRYVELREE